MISTADFLGITIKRQSTRRWIVVLYWLFVAAAYALVQRSMALHSQHRESFRLLVTLQMLTFLPAILGGVRAGGFVKPFHGIHWVPLYERNDTQTFLGKTQPVYRSLLAADAELDERETRQRDRTHFIAYTLMRWIALAVFGVYAVMGALNLAWVAILGPAFFFAITLTLWSLPQSLILWTEPDMETAP